ncbi:hypothetical protein RB195_014198 [Necator americanus]|uniref:Uncharacterized protein n=1 Tax=Necator americanus TaxID=51031 RepID=A0ABR1DZ07_NECAM
MISSVAGSSLDTNRRSADYGTEVRQRRDDYDDDLVTFQSEISMNVDTDESAQIIDHSVLKGQSRDVRIRPVYGQPTGSFDAIPYCRVDSAHNRIQLNVVVFVRTLAHCAANNAVKRITLGS